MRVIKLWYTIDNFKHQLIVVHQFVHLQPAALSRTLCSSGVTCRASISYRFKVLNENGNKIVHFEDGRHFAIVVPVKCLSTIRTSCPEKRIYISLLFYCLFYNFIIFFLFSVSTVIANSVCHTNWLPSDWRNAYRQCQCKYKEQLQLANQTWSDICSNALPS